MRTALLIAALSALAQSSATATASVEIVTEVGGLDVDGGTISNAQTDGGLAVYE